VKQIQFAPGTQVRQVPLNIDWGLDYQLYRAVGNWPPGFEMGTWINVGIRVMDDRVDDKWTYITRFIDPDRGMELEWLVPTARFWGIPHHELVAQGLMAVVPSDTRSW
jgi:hypothetical protein